MNEEKRPSGGAKPVESRDKRLKAALKANLARRKAQSRARSGEPRRGGDSAEAKGRD